MTYKELVENHIDKIKVLSYGYTERGLFNSHFEPFSRKREFTFEVTPFGPEHSWLYFENEDDEVFEIKDGVAVCDDPELWAKP